MRILLATDNHIGYMERDPIRGQDSINTFKEILQLAVKNDVWLFSGDYKNKNILTLPVSRLTSSFWLETYSMKINHLEIASTKSQLSCVNLRWAKNLWKLSY
jgi:hypothetical protein